jgi:ArsR family transcriptional regulator
MVKDKERAHTGTTVTGIPEPIKEELCTLGGIEGLIAQMPGREEIVAESRAYHVVSDPVRLTILYLLARQPFCVCVIKEVIGIADSKLSYHLSHLSKAGLIRGTRQGNWIIYQITEDGRRFVRRSRA